MNRRLKVGLSIGVGVFLLLAFTGLIGAQVFLASTSVPQERQVAINEVAWGGGRGATSGEWIELLNLTDRAVDLDGWRLVSSDRSPEIFLRGLIDPVQRYPVLSGGVYLLERDDDDTVLDIVADLIYTGALRDGGETLYLIDPAGNIVDTANQEGGPWPAGAGGDAPRTMERIDPTGADDPANWATSIDYGTPRAKNAAFNFPPRAVFSFDPLRASPGETVSFDASSSYDRWGKIVAYRWDFGDGLLGEGQITSHAFIEAGIYTVALVVEDDRGGWAKRAKEIHIAINEPPRPDFSLRAASSSRILRSLDEILFFDESYDPDGEVVGWEWKFGDGSLGEGQTASHTYARGGYYTITLCVTDDHGERVCRARTIFIHSRVPIALFEFVPEVPNTGREVLFDAGGSFDLDGYVVRYDWDFDSDGTIDLSTDDPTAVHVFPIGGEHVVTLAVVDEHGILSLPYSDTIYVNKDPVPAFQVSNFFPDELETVLFTDLSHDPDGNIIAWHWDFGDGATGEGQIVSHAYQDDGVQTVTLTVTDDNGAQAKLWAEITVKNLPPVAHLDVEIARRYTDDTFVFDGSRSYDRSPRGVIVLYEWDLGADGTYEKTTTTPMFRHSYADDGTYKVRLRVTDDDGATALSNTITLLVDNRAPRCESICWTPLTPTDAERVEFSAVVSDRDGRVVGWRWCFGDGTTSTEQTPTHLFPNDGEYTISLVVRDDDGKESISCTRTITVTNAPPVALFSISTASPRVGEIVRFTDLSYDPSLAGKIVHWAWNFGDGTFCPGTPGGCGVGDVHSPTRVYTAAGTYTVTLTVIDDDGAIASVAKVITVSE